MRNFSANPAASGLVAVLFFVAGFMFPGAPPAGATDHVGASPWVYTDYARIRLVPGAIRSDGKRWLGVHIELEPGWVTYWRNPGYSGVPPRFDWSKSANLADAKVSYPAPRRLKSDYGVSYGYLNQVVFPVLISPGASDRDIKIELFAEYAVCREICIPEYSDLAIVLPGIEGDDSQVGQELQNLVADFTARVPRAQTADTALRIETASVEKRSGRTVLSVIAALDGAAAGVELFVEGPDRYYFTVPDGPRDIGDGRGLFVVAIEGAKSVDDLAGARLGGTLVTPGGATEYWWTVE
ncbi:hypothetical protein MNBD_ALPHA09-1835 [hydrothermal vent metagenome]|uniref:Thiol:disulfide interchange protein DsbD N-terminal domain-containing protein n=1 Tax=hydrothermal vent metagenome TaxID=652676 RepID=A0A3B0UBG8_9ZZZZ